MTPVPFFLAPLALGSGVVAGMFVMWLLVRGRLTRLVDVRIVLNRFEMWHREFRKRPQSDEMNKMSNAQAVWFFADANRALSGKERK